MAPATALRLARVLHTLESVRLALTANDVDTATTLLQEATDALAKLAEEVR